MKLWGVNEAATSAELGLRLRWISLGTRESCVDEFAEGQASADEEDFDLRAEVERASLTEDRRRGLVPFSVVRVGTAGGGIEESEVAKAEEEGAVRVRVGDCGRACVNVEVEVETDASAGDAGIGVEDFDGGTLSERELGAAEHEESSNKELLVFRPSGAEFPRDPRQGFGDATATGTSMRLRGR